MLKVSPRPALGAVPAPLFLWARPIEAHNPQKTQITTKKARKLLYDTIICTTFGQAIRRERRESHCYHRKSGILQSDGNKRMSRRVVTTPDW